MNIVSENNMLATLQVGVNVNYVSGHRNFGKYF